jgi:beta-phosphoglucomutase-like phosphatase (HAD superfamily)
LDDLVKLEIPHTIATASGKNNVDFFIQHLDLDRWFEQEKIMYDDGQISGKPAPDLYLRAAENLNLSPESCVVVEDSHSGIQAAHAAGIGWLMALGPTQTHPKLAQLPGVDQVVESLQEVVCQDIFDLASE